MMQCLQIPPVAVLLLNSPPRQLWQALYPLQLHAMDREMVLQRLQLREGLHHIHTYGIPEQQHPLFPISTPEPTRLL